MWVINPFTLHPLLAEVVEFLSFSADLGVSCRRSVSCILRVLCRRGVLRGRRVLCGCQVSDAKKHFYSHGLDVDFMC